MLSRRSLVRAAVPLLIGSCLVLGSARPGWADDGSASSWDGGGNVYVGAQVGGTPSSTPTDDGGGDATSGDDSGSSSSSPSACAEAPDPGDTNPAPAGAGPGQWDIEICAATINDVDTTGGSWTDVWVSNPAPPPPPPPPDPGTVAAQAESEMSLPSPTIDLNPSAFGVVNFPEWLWVDPSVWQPFSTSATACNAGGCVTATATATPQSVYFSTGDGSGVGCDGPGVPYDTSEPPDVQSTYCSYTYGESSLGEPSPDGNPNDAAYPVTATITWSVSWTASGAASGSGTLPDLTTSGSTTLRVEQIESVITGS